jgi:ribose transport system ATP-binding protein
MLLSATGIHKSYGAAAVLKGIDFDVSAGEIHAIIGENGAGKSTLIKILSGALTPDKGVVQLNGSTLPSGDAGAAMRRGINVVYQEFTLVPDLTVEQNIFLGRELSSVWLRRADMTRIVKGVLDDLGVSVSPAAIVRGLSVAHQQLIEIARALISDAKVLILDEPSAALPGHEVRRLMDLLRALRNKGMGIVYISHRLEEVLDIADRVTVLRDGAKITSCAVSQCQKSDLIRWMVGRDVSEEFPERHHVRGATVLEVKDLSYPSRLRRVSLNVHAGEIVGVGGLVGAGRTSTAMALMGALPRARIGGEMTFNGEAVKFRSPRQALKKGLAYVTEDRKAYGIFPAMATKHNVTLSRLREFSRHGLLHLSSETLAARQALASFQIRTTALDEPIRTLSGGNQQKALLARFLSTPPRLVILDEPTRGVDVGARADIYHLMNRLTAAGMGILMISSDLPELLGMSDRVVVMSGGETKGELSRGEATAERVMSLAMPSQ